MAGSVLRDARRRSGLSQRQLARRARTSHSTLAAYESGAKTPNVATLIRLVNAAGFSLDAELVANQPFEHRAAQGRCLDAVLELAEAFPVRHFSALRYPAFGART